MKQSGILTTTVVAMLILLALTADAYAYLDPGTGSFILQMLIAGAVGMFSAVIIYWRKLKSLFTRRSDEAPSQENEDD